MLKYLVKIMIKKIICRIFGHNVHLKFNKKSKCKRCYKQFSSINDSIEKQRNNDFIKIFEVTFK